jgi:sugar lactone lactonase YvrE
MKHPAAGLTTVIDDREFLECPRWHDGRLYVSDIYSDSVYEVDEGDIRIAARLDDNPAGLGWLPDGTLVVVAQQERKLLRVNAGGLLEHADMSALMGGNANDMIIGPTGVAYVGNFGFDLSDMSGFRPAPLVRVDPDGHAEVASESLLFPNGMAITPDGRTLIVAETWGNRLSAFPIDEQGSLGERRDWAVFAEPLRTANVMELIAAAAVGADGICLDKDGAVWLADAYHARVLKVAQGGDVLCSVELGSDNAYAVALGGTAADDLYMCLSPSPFERDPGAAPSSRVVRAPVALLTGKPSEL